MNLRVGASLLTCLLNPLDVNKAEGCMKNCARDLLGVGIAGVLLTERASLGTGLRLDLICNHTCKRQKQVKGFPIVRCIPQSWHTSLITPR